MRAKWTINQIDQSKRRIKGFLEQKPFAQSGISKMEYILTKIDELSNSTSPHLQLEQFIYIMSALVCQRNESALPMSQVKHLMSRAEALLLTNGIKAKDSASSILYNELNTVVSQIYLKNGQTFESAWALNLARQFSGKTLYSQAHEALSHGLRHISLNNVSLALQYFEQARQGNPSPAELEKIVINEIKCLRLSGQLQRARDQLAEYDSWLNASAASDKFKLEMQWESKLLDCLRDRDPRALLKLCKRGQSHCLTTYALEAFLWQSCFEPHKKVLPKLQTIQQYKGIEFASDKIYYRIAQAIEEGADAKRPIYGRLEKLGQALGEATRLSSPDKKLLTDRLREI
jgi:hypothetical protein